MAWAFPVAANRAGYSSERRGRCMKEPLLSVLFLPSRVLSPVLLRYGDKPARVSTEEELLFGVLYVFFSMSLERSLSSVRMPQIASSSAIISIFSHVLPVGTGSVRASDFEDHKGSSW